MGHRLVGARPDLAFTQHVPAVAEGKVIHQRNTSDLDIVEGADQPVEAGGERGGGLGLAVVYTGQRLEHGGDGLALDQHDAGAAAGDLHEALDAARRPSLPQPDLPGTRQSERSQTTEHRN